MKKYIFITYCIAAVCMFTGCAKSNPSPEDEALMHFFPTLPGTKATDSAFEAGDSFGIYAVEYAEAALPRFRFQATGQTMPRPVLMAADGL